MTISRRTLLKGAAAAGGLAALGARGATALPSATPSVRTDLGLPSNAPIDTFVVVMMENRSFDHFLGWMQQDGAIANRNKKYVDTDGIDWRPYHLAPDYRGCGHPDPGHGWNAGRAQLTDRRDASGFLAAGSGNDEFAVGYYESEDLPIWTALTQQGTTFDNYFCSVLTSTWPNRWYQHGATSGGRKSNTPPMTPMGYDETTIWHRCDKAGVSWAYYYSNLPFIGLYGADFVAPHLANIRHVSAFHADAAAGLLPQVCFVDPYFTVPAENIGNDDHPLADIRLGQQFIGDIARSFASGPQFQRGALFVNYDEWGGFFDHVIPDIVPDDHAADGFGQRGFRTPAAVISPYARQGGIGSQLVPDATYDATSILKLIEWRFGMAPLTSRDAAALNIGEHVLDFEQTPVEVEIPDYRAPSDAYMACAAEELVPSASDEEAGWETLLERGFYEAVGLRTDYQLKDSFA